MDEKIKDSVSLYMMGIITYSELARMIAETDTNDGRIVAQEIANIENSDEYNRLLCEFRRGVKLLMMSNKRLSTIVDYLILTGK